VQLTDREIKIIYLLLNRNEPITIQKLSELYGVSVRTIKYDLKDIKAGFKEDDELFKAKPHVGVWITNDNDLREAVRKKLLGQTGFEYYPDPQKRILQIAFLLSLTDQAVTLQQLENKLNVSESTLLNDLERFRDSINSFEIKLVHKSFYGYILIGSEYAIRSYLEAVLQKVISNFDIYSLIHLLQTDSEEINGQLSSLLMGLNVEFEYIFKRILYYASGMVASDEEDVNYNEILAISSRLAIIIARLSINKPIGSYQEIDIAGFDADNLNFQLFKKVCGEYDFLLYEDEYQYLINGNQTISKDKDLAALTQKIIHSVGIQTGKPFEKDKQLFDSLLSHLISRLNSKYQFTSEYNPFVKDIKANYPELFGVIYQVCIDEVSINPAIVNDSFVSFLALHFMVSEQRIHKTQKKVRVVYVCSTGLGVTSLLQQKIEENISAIEIAGFTSLLSAKRQVKKIRPDLVISIFDLPDIDVPVIQVNPLPTKQDIEEIRKKVVMISKARPEQVAGKKRDFEDVSKNVSLRNFSRNLIMTMFSIYEETYGLLRENIPAIYQDAFMLHIFMLIHRINFNEEYQDSVDFKVEDTELRVKIQNIFNEYQLEINDSEIQAILEYTHIDNPQEE